ncbi:unnamed protein product, partial [Ceratitis capitata]
QTETDSHRTPHMQQGIIATATATHKAIATKQEFGVVALRHACVFVGFVHEFTGI